MRFAPFAALALALLLGPSADAEKIPEIQETGIAEFDPTFLSAKAIDESLVTLGRTLKSANQNLATALALPQTTSLDNSLAELKKRAGNKVTATLESGRWPKLTANSAVSSDVGAGIEATNALVSDLISATDTLNGLPKESADLLGKARAFPDQLKPELLTKNNLSVLQLPKINEKLVNNLKAIEATPERIKGVTDQTMNMTARIVEVFPVSK